MTKYRLTILLTLFLLTNCTSDNYELTVAFPQADGLTTYSRVTLNGLEVGHIESVKLGQQKEILATVIFDKVDQLSLDTKFILVKDFLGSTSIEIKSGTGDEFLTKGQQIAGQLEENDSKGLGTGINLVESFLGVQSKQDSILLELKRLNKNIERLIEKK